MGKSGRRKRPRRATTPPAPRPAAGTTSEELRLLEDSRREKNWKRWGPYLAERQWATVREDYSADGNCWKSFPHDHARSRAYRWGEDGLFGFTDRECRLCFSVALWNGKDPILKERLFGLDNEEGNHGEDAKELWWYLAATPTHSYGKSLYKYPQAEFPYARLVEENRRRGKRDAEYELADSGVFAEERYFDVTCEFAKATPDDIHVRLRVTNRGPERAPLHVLPQLWFRNTWSWGCTHEGCTAPPVLRVDPHDDVGCVAADHPTLGPMLAWFGPEPDGDLPELLFTENETNFERLFATPNSRPYVKDAFHEFVIRGRQDAVNPARTGTKMAAHYVLDLAPGATETIHVRLTEREEAGRLRPRRTGARDTAASARARARDTASARASDRVLAERLADYEEFARRDEPAALTVAERNVLRQARAGLLYSKQFYHYVVKDWLDGDPGQPPPPAQRKEGRNRDWRHLFNRDVIAMPDKWEYPWYAAWDLAFHMIPFAGLDPQFAKEQLVLFLREWYMHPSGQLPAYEFALSDVNPPVHAWAVWRVYKMTGPKGRRDRTFLARCFQKLLINFTWWVNRKDVEGRHLFAGGFLGLDNIGLFDRSHPLPGCARLEQADGTAWMAFFCSTMLSMALELADEDPAYEDLASKFFEHFVSIVDAMNSLGGTGLWNEEDGFYYDQLQLLGPGGTETVPLRIRSMVGIIPLFAVEVLERKLLDHLPAFRKRTRWFFENRFDLARHISWFVGSTHHAGDGDRELQPERFLLAVPSRERLERVLRYVLDENELLSAHGVRSLSRFHLHRPFTFERDGDRQSVVYEPGESTTALFGGNSNWRGPVWLPLNYLLVEALERYHHFYGESFTIECPTGSGHRLTLKGVAHELSRRLVSLFLPDSSGKRPVLGDDPRQNHANWNDLVPFHEFFHGETGKGLGASHQTGWTALVTVLLLSQARERAAAPVRTRGSARGPS